jgi:hypothetical protein
MTLRVVRVTVVMVVGSVIAVAVVESVVIVIGARC